MTAKEIYEFLSGNECPDNFNDFLEWYTGYVKWLEKEVEERYKDMP